MEALILLLAVITFALLGSFVGLLTGLTPGLHVNTVALVLVSAQGALLALVGLLFGWAAPEAVEAGIVVASLVVGLISTHIFLDYIPSTFLGAPDPDTVLSVLPAHRLLLRGQGFAALRLAAYGCFGAFLMGMALLLPLRLIVGSPVDAYDKLRPALPFILITVAALLVATEGPRPREVLVLVVPPEPGVRVAEGTDVPDPRVTVSGVRTRTGEPVLLEGRISRTAPGWTLEDSTGRLPLRILGPDPPEGHARLQGIPTLEVVDDAALRSRATALGLFLLAGGLGWVVLANNALSVDNWFPLPSLVQDTGGILLFPLFTGLFGLAGLVVSRATFPRLPVQDSDPSDLGLSRRGWARGLATGTLAGAMTGWFPGLSGGATATVASLLATDGRHQGEGEEAPREMLVALAGANTATALFTLAALFIILRARSGGVAAIEALVPPAVLPWEPVAQVPLAFALFLVAAVVSTALGLLYLLVLGRPLVKLLQAVPYRPMVDVTILFLAAMILVFSGVVGLAIAGVALAVGLLPPLLGVRRVHLMGALLVPVILFLWGFGP